MTEVIAHRGASASELENTVAAFARAVEMGADAIELDINYTADGALALWHDREAGGRPLSEMTLDELRRVAEPTHPDGVPDLAEVLAAVPPHITMYIEIKTLDKQFDDTLIEIIRSSPTPGRCAVHAFDHRIIRRLTTHEPDLVAGVLSSSYPLDPVAQMQLAGASVFWQHRYHIDDELVETVHATGGRVIAWTVDDPEQMRRLAELGVDGICSNTPDVLRRTIT